MPPCRHRVSPMLMRTWTRHGSMRQKIDCDGRTEGDSTRRAGRAAHHSKGSRVKSLHGWGTLTKHEGGELIQRITKGTLRRYWQSQVDGLARLGVVMWENVARSAKNHFPPTHVFCEFRRNGLFSSVVWERERDIGDCWSECKQPLCHILCVSISVSVSTQHANSFLNGPFSANESFLRDDASESALCLHMYPKERNVEFSRRHFF